MNDRLQAVLNGKEDNYLLPLFWLKGEEAGTVRDDLRRVYESGIRAVTIEPRPHPDYLGPGWWSVMDAVMEEARALGMRVWLWDDDHFPTGHIAGMLKDGPPDLRRLFLRERHIDALGPAEHASFIIKPCGDTVFQAWDGELAAVIAVKRDPQTGRLSEEAVDVTEYVENGILYWPVPDGYWRLFIFEETDKGGSEKTKDYFNPLNRESVRLLIDTVHEAFYERYRDDFGRTFAGFFSDEPAFYNDPKTYDFQSSLGKAGVPIPWSNELRQRLQERLGEQYRLLLPCLFYEGHSQTSAVRYAYMDLVSSLYAENFGMQLGDWCRERNVEYIGHILEDNNVHTRLGCGAGHYFRALWGQDMSGVDVVLWQLNPGFDEVPFRWFVEEADSEFFHYGMAKMASSLGHLDPKKKGRTMAEVFGAYGWAEGLKLMKWLTDHMLVRGVNHFSPHAFSSKPFPDPDCPPHLDARGNNPQFRYYSLLNHYTNRMSHLLSQGRHKATAAVLYHAEAEWSGEAMFFHKPMKQLMRRQIDCDVLHVDGLLQYVHVRDGKLHSHSEQYDCLIIPFSEALPAAVLGKLAAFAEQGLSVLFIQGLPERASEGTEVEDVLQALAGHEHVTVVPLEELADHLLASGMYEIRAREDQPYLRHYHVEHADMDVFMFFNEHPLRAIDTQVLLPVSGSVVRYDAYRNKLSRPIIEETEGGGWLTVSLEPFESCLVIAGEGAAHVEADPITTPNTVIAQLSGSWRVSTATAGQYPEFALWGELGTLCDLSRPDKLPSFSGTIRYESRFDWDQERERVWLDLGAVYETAEVKVNGQPAGVCISTPYRLEIGSLLKPGSNHIAIEVTNTLVKQLRDMMSTYGQQEPTGLIGPVKLLGHE